MIVWRSLFSRSLAMTWGPGYDSMNESRFSLFGNQWAKIIKIKSYRLSSSLDWLYLTVSKPYIGIYVSLICEHYFILRFIWFGEARLVWSLPLTSIACKHNAWEMEWKAAFVTRIISSLSGGCHMGRILRIDRGKPMYALCIITCIQLVISYRFNMLAMK